MRSTTDIRDPKESFLQVQGIVKRFGEESVLRDLDLGVTRGTTVSILGRSGSGKTTLLKIIAGLEQADAGSVRLDGREIGGLPAQSRGVVYLYQEPLLFPHMNVFENIAFGLRIRKTARKDVRRRVDEMLDALDLSDHADKMPHQVSGGQRQRVAFGRAAILAPAALLLDEPFGALDPEVRAEMQHLFRSRAHEFGITTLLVTHDLKEAIVMGDVMGHLEDGSLRLYRSMNAFLDAAPLGVQREIEFWAGLRGRGSEGAGETEPPGP